MPDNIYQSAKQKIGSCFTSDGVQHTGMTQSQKEKYMPTILGMAYTDPGFQIQMKNWFADFSLLVPIEGTKLNIGLSESGEPEVLFDYVRYLYIKSHPDVAPNKEEADRSRRARFYIHDEAIAKKAGYDLVAKRKAAYKEFILLEDNSKKVDQLLRLYGRNPAKMSKEEKSIYLESEVNSDPVTFALRATSKDLEMQAFIEQLLSENLIRKVGNTYLDGDVSLGESMEEAVKYLQNAKHSSELQTLKARLQQKESQPA